MTTDPMTVSERLRARALTGMPGHLVGGTIDWFAFTGRAAWRGVRRRVRRPRPAR